MHAVNAAGYVHAALPGPADGTLYMHEELVATCPRDPERDALDTMVTVLGTLFKIL